MSGDTRIYRTWEKILGEGEPQAIDARVRTKMFSVVESVKGLDEVWSASTYGKIFAKEFERDPEGYLIPFILSEGWGLSEGGIFVFGESYQGSAMNPDKYIGRVRLALRTASGFERLIDLPLVKELKQIAERCGLNHDEDFFQEYANPKIALLKR